MLNVIYMLLHSKICILHTEIMEAWKFLHPIFATYIMILSCNCIIRHVYCYDLTYVKLLDRLSMIPLADLLIFWSSVIIYISLILWLTSLHPSARQGLYYFSANFITLESRVPVGEQCLSYPSGYKWTWLISVESRNKIS